MTIPKFYPIYTRNVPELYNSKSLIVQGLYNGIPMKQFEGLSPFSNLVSYFPPSKSCTNTNRELPWLYEGFTWGVQGIYPNCTSPFA